MALALLINLHRKMIFASGLNCKSYTRVPSTACTWQLAFRVDNPASTGIKNSMHRSFYVFTILALFCASPLQAAAKKLIEFGWDEPDTPYMKEHIQQMEKTPFDGCVFHIKYKRPNGSHGDFIWEAWSKRAFHEDELKEALDDLKQTKFRKFKYNFLRFNTVPGDVDWFGDYSAITNNARLVARIAKSGRVRGILFDIEQYGTQLFDFHKQVDKSKSWDEYAAQARLRGREVMTAFQSEFSDVVIFLTFGYSLPWVQSGQGKKPLADCNYGLLAPFLDGMLDTAGKKVRFVDGHELSYGFREPQQFEKAYRMMKSELLPIVAEPKKYADHFSLGFGIWMDNSRHKLGWSTNDFGKNYFTPEAYAASLRNAVQHADEYVWVYTEAPRWWDKQGNSQNLPEVYERGTRGARGK